MRASRLLPLSLVLLAAGCADPEPFVYDPLYGTVRISKPVDPVLKTGLLYICYSDETPMSEVIDLARERCAAHGLQLSQTGATTRWSCKVASPHLASFSCYDPDMALNGRYINPFNRAAVAEWERRTGKKAKPHNFMTAEAENDGEKRGSAPQAPFYVDAPAPPPASGVANTPAPAPAATAPAATPLPQPPAPAQLTPVPALTPADIAGKPAPAPAPRVQSAPPPPPPAPVDDFSLPPGSWGDHFKE